ncbi:conserved hypothetical protein [Candida dubliniensis CD36]|uniref:Uncharacterized protein n=1 Tax=Candida dubliniensis (strain CD36 / ATCC MYA-646 / CBS 7987 / NCPF 3949 / NRRL Y-17841) TaxID=573826 RepID=B9WF68_CANDC|nr:conserved hypothetical protein [Candida dubliniensis CD36]CAX42524.1 conserved hypothetical protein [Candida dubliniensis CD36]
MLTLDDDLKLVILEYHNYHSSISLEHSIDKTWNYFQSLIPQLTKPALQLILDSQGVIRKNSISRLNEYTILEYLIKLWTPELDLNDVIDLVTNLSSISPLNQDKIINGVERYEDLSSELTIEEQVSAIFQKPYSNNDIYYLDEINFPANGDMTTITLSGNLSGTDFLDPLVVTSSISETFNFYPTGLLNPFHLYIYLLRLNLQLQLQGRKILLILHNNCWMNRFFTNIELLYISKHLDGYYHKDYMKFPGDYGLKNWLRQSLHNTSIIPNLLFNYNQLIQKLKSDPVMFKFNQLCIEKSFFSTVEDESLDNPRIEFSDGIFILDGESGNDGFILDYHYSIKDIISIMIRLNDFEIYVPSLKSMDWDRVSDVFLNEIFPCIRNSDLYFKFSILYNELHMKNAQSSVDQSIQPSGVFSVPPNHVHLVDLICKLNDSLKRTVDKSHLLSTLHPEGSMMGTVQSSRASVSESEASEDGSDSRKRPNDSEEEVRTIKKSKILQMLEKNDLHFVEAFEEDEDEENEESADDADGLLNDSFADKIKRSKYTPHTSANASLVNGTGSSLNNTPQTIVSGKEPPTQVEPKDTPIIQTAADNSHQTSKLGMLRSLIDLQPPTSTKPVVSGFSFSLPKNTKLSRNFDGSDDESSEESASSVSTDERRSETVTTTSRTGDNVDLSEIHSVSVKEPTNKLTNNDVQENVKAGTENEVAPVPVPKTIGGNEVRDEGEGEGEKEDKDEDGMEIVSEAKDKPEAKDEMEVEVESGDEGENESESDSETESESESESDSGSEYVDDSSETSSLKEEKTVSKKTRKIATIDSDSSFSGNDVEGANPETPAIDSDGSSNSDTESVNPETPAKDTVDSSSNSDTEMANPETPAKDSDSSSSSSDAEVESKPETPTIDSDSSSSSSDAETANPETPAIDSDSPSSSSNDEVANPETPAKDSDSSSSSSNDEVANPETPAKDSDSSSSSSDTEISSDPETPPKLNQKPSPEVTPVNNNDNVNLNKSESVVTRPLMTKSKVAAPLQVLHFTPRRGKVVLSKEFVSDSDDDTEVEESSAAHGIEKESPSKIQNNSKLKTIPVNVASVSTPSIPKTVKQPDSNNSSSESSDDSDSSSSESGSDSSETDSDSSDESMDSSDESGESSESSDDAPKPVIKTTKLKSTGNSEKPQTVASHAKIQKPSSVVASGKSKKISGPAPPPKKNQRLASLKDLKQPRTTIEIKKPILLSPTKPKKKFSKIFDSSDDESSESDSDSEVPMSQLKIGGVPKRSTKPSVKSDTSEESSSSDGSDDSSSDDSSSDESSSEDSSSEDSSSSDSSSSDSSSSDSSSDESS